MGFFSKALSAGKTGLGVGKFLGGVARTGMRDASSVLSFAMQNPKTAIAFGAVGLGAYGLARSGTGDAGSSLSGMSAVAQKSGLPSTGFDLGMGASRRQEDRFMFENSTSGLVQGLSRGRHGR